MNTEGGGFEYFETNRYKNPRNKKLTLFLDIGNENLSGGRDTPFNITLTEPLLIDKQSEIYIDNFITFNSMMADVSERSCFVLKINEFNINSGVAVSDDNKKSRNYYNSLIIPNENRNVANFYSTVSHKAKKYNYVCDINPTKLYNISGYLTDLSGNPIFNGNIYKNSNNDEYKYTYATIGVTKWTYKDGGHQNDLKLSAYTNERATLYAVKTGVADADATIDVNDLNNENVTSFEIIFLSNAEKDSNIYFASTKPLRDIRRDYTKCIITLKHNSGQLIHYELTDGYIVDNRAIDPKDDNTPIPEEGYSSANKGRAIIEFAVISK